MGAGGSPGGGGMGGGLLDGFGGGGHFMGFGTRVLPDPDDAGTNEDVLLLRSDFPSLRGAWHEGKNNLVQLIFRVVTSGAVSVNPNTWTLHPYLIPNSHEDRANWDLWPFPRGVFGELLPWRILDSSQLPAVALVQVPLRAMMADWGIHFARGGSDDQDIEVQVWTDSFVAV